MLLGTWYMYVYMLSLVKNWTPVNHDIERTTAVTVISSVDTFEWDYLNGYFNGGGSLSCLEGLITFPD